MAVVAQVPADCGARSTGAGAYHDPFRHRVRLQVQLAENRFGDIVVAAPVRRPLGVGELVHVMPVAGGCHVFGHRVHVRGVFHQQTRAAELFDKCDLLRAGGARHDGDEREAQQLGEVRLRNGGASAGGFHDGGVRPDPAVDQAEQEQRPGQPVLEAAGPVRGLVLEVQLDAPMLRQRHRVEMGVRGTVVLRRDGADGPVRPVPVRSAAARAGAALDLHRTSLPAQPDCPSRVGPVPAPAGGPGSRRRSSMNPLIDVPGLEARLAAGHRTVLLDVRWALGDPYGHEHYLAEHLPGAVFVDLATELSDPAVPDRGRHPLPSRSQFQESARRWGIRNGDVVVAYDDSANMAAARLWWMLREAGFTGAYLLDGGLGAWRKAGMPLESGPVRPARGDVDLGGGGMPVLDAGAAATWSGHGLLLDARAGERYRGEVEPVDPRAGHIPGAVSAPTADNVDDSGHFLPPAELRRKFESLGAG